MPLIIPTNADDRLEGTSRADLMSGLAGDDRLFGGAGRDVFLDGEYTWDGENVTLPGATRPYLVNGRSYDFGEGSDHYNGGAGFDRLYYSNRAAPVTVNLRESTVETFVGTDTFAGIEVIFLTTGDDTVIQRSGRPTVVMGAGNDTAIVRTMGLSDMRAGSGRDTLDMTGVRDEVLVDLSLNGWVSSGNHSATIRGFDVYLGSSTERNEFEGSGRRDVFTGGAADDELTGNRGSDRLRGEDGHDLLLGGVGHDRLWGGSGADSINGGAGFDRIYAGAGDDLIEDHAGGGIIRAGSGHDVIYMNGGWSRAWGGYGEDTFHVAGGVARGGRGYDTFYATHYSEAYGDSGRDQFYLRSADDHDHISGEYFGGVGNDRFEISNTHDAEFSAVIVGGDGTDILSVNGGGQFNFSEYSPGTSGSSYIAEIEYVIFQEGAFEINVDSRVADIGFEFQGDTGCTIRLDGGGGRLNASYGDDVITDFTSAWVIDGRTGNDTIEIYSGSAIGGHGNDHITVYDVGSVDAGVGNDTVVVEASVNGEVTEIMLGDGNDRLEARWGLGYADLGNGADYALISYGHELLTLNLGSTGDGADTLSIEENSYGTLILDHFDIAQDRLVSHSTRASEAPFDSLSDFQVTQDGSDAVLTRVNNPDLIDDVLIIRLTDVSAASLTDDIFV